MSNAIGDEGHERTALYKLYDGDELLLYVGIAADPKQRWSQHRAEKPWWNRVVTRTIEWFPDLPSALAAEMDCIRSERPIFNRRGSAWLKAETGQPRFKAYGLSEAKQSLHLIADEVVLSGIPVLLSRRSRPLVAVIPCALLGVIEEGNML